MDALANTLYCVLYLSHSVQESSSSFALFTIHQQTDGFTSSPGRDLPRTASVSSNGGNDDVAEEEGEELFGDRMKQ